MDRIRRLTLILPLLTTLVLMPACKSDKQDTGWMNQSFALDEDSAAVVKDSVDFILGKAMQHNTRFETFSAQMDIKMQAEGFRIGIGGSVRIANQKIIWGTISKLIEIARFTITPDSLILWSKLNNSAFIYTDTVLEVEGKSIHLMPFIYRFTECFLLCQIDTMMLEGTRTLNSSDPDVWIIDGLMNDSIAWQCRIGRSDFRIKNMLVSMKQKEIMQAELNYSENGGFGVRLSAGEKQMFAATVKYNKVKWNEQQSYPMNFNAGTKISRNKGLMMESKALTDSL